ncbi:MAG TPA: cupredoxin domain-containing protein [Actinomycetota bacterium]|nr:cupredoxin domain-containing protein [Actinomycetota bacterium]
MKGIKHGLLSLGLGVALVACGGGGGSGTETEGGGESGGATEASSLVMVDNAFEPAELTIGAGSELELSNQGQAPHNLTIEGTSIDEDLDAGGSSTVTLDAEPGTYTMFCEFHRSAGMEGTVTIQ